MQVVTYECFHGWIRNFGFERYFSCRRCGVFRGYHILMRSEKYGEFLLCPPLLSNVSSEAGDEMSPCDPGDY